MHDNISIYNYVGPFRLINRQFHSIGGYVPQPSCLRPLLVITIAAYGRHSTFTIPSGMVAWPLLRDRMVPIPVVPWFQWRNPIWSRPLCNPKSYMHEPYFHINLPWCHEMHMKIT